MSCSQDGARVFDQRGVREGQGRRDDALLGLQLEARERLGRDEVRRCGAGGVMSCSLARMVPRSSAQALAGPRRIARGSALIALTNGSKTSAQIASLNGQP